MLDKPTNRGSGPIEAEKRSIVLNFTIPPLFIMVDLINYIVVNFQKLSSLKHEMEDCKEPMAELTNEYRRCRQSELSLEKQLKVRV